MFSPQSVSVSILCVVLLSLGAFVFRREPQASVNRLFAFSMCSIAGWIGAISVALSTGDLSSAATFGRIAFASPGYENCKFAICYWEFSLVALAQSPRIFSYHWPGRLLGTALWGRISHSSWQGSRRTPSSGIV